MYVRSSMVVPGDVYAPPRPARSPSVRSRLTPKQIRIFRRPDLLERGLTDSRLRRAVSAGTLQRIAPGWYALPDANPSVLRVITAGYRLTCIDALELHNLWIPHRADADARGTHVYRSRRTSKPPSWAVDHAAGLQKWPESDAVASAPMALHHAVRCLDQETAAILLESALNTKMLPASEVTTILDSSPAKVRRRIGKLSTASESGSETRVARALRRRGYRVEQQVFVDGAGFIDAYVSGLFLEIDGRAHHSSPEAFDRDRRRDLAARQLGLQLLRLSYDQVWKSWSTTLPALLETIRQVGPMGRKRVRELTG